jgi:hypothetical protein
MNELYSLKWKNHQLNLVDVFEDLWEKEAFVDLTLSCPGGKNFSAHRIVLSACSLYFRELLLDPTLQSSKHPVVFLRDVRSEELEALLRFMYRGHIDVMHEDLGPLLKLAHALQIKGLASVASEEQTNGGDGEPTTVKRRNEVQRAPPRSAKKRKSDSPVSSTSKCERVSTGDGGFLSVSRRPSSTPNEEEEDDEHDRRHQSSINAPVIAGGEEDDASCDKKIQSSGLFSSKPADLSCGGSDARSPHPDDRDLMNVQSKTESTGDVDTDEFRDDSVDFEEYGDDGHHEMSRWVRQCDSTPTSILILEICS